jgi:hypothetical protein
MLTIGLIAILAIAYAIASATDDPNERAEEDSGLAKLRSNGLI